MFNERIVKESDNYTFDAVSVKNAIVTWIREYFRSNGPDSNAIVGISGGKDSSVVAALCVEALGANRVIGVLMPNGEQGDIQYAKDLVSHLGIESVEINICKAYNAIIDEMVNNLSPVVSDQTKTNLPARIRMATLYAVAQTRKGRVANTCNLSEDWVGYSTRYGDSAGDFAPLARLTVNEVLQIGIELGLPHGLVFKTPSDGLSGKTDEDNLGFTYDFLDRYIRTGKYGNDTATAARIDDLHMKNKFKLQLMPCFEYYPLEWVTKPVRE